MSFARTFNLGLGRQMLMTKETNKMNTEEPWQIVFRLRTETSGLDDPKLTIGYSTEELRDYVYDNMTDKDVKELADSTKSLVKKFHRK